MQASVPSSLDTRDDEVVVGIARANPDWEIEIGPRGEVRFSPLSGTSGSRKEMEAYRQLAAWQRSSGGLAFGPSGGFRMPDSSVLGPDAAWVSQTQVDGLSPDRTELTFWTICPAVVIEVLGDWSSWPELRSKIERYREYGASYVVAIWPETREMFALGEPPAGLVLDVAAICDA